MRNLCTLILCLVVINTLGQNTIGLPDVTNYKKKDYKAGLQNWDIKQDYKGIIYIANNEGLLAYDGSTWQLLPLPNRTIVRSVEIGEKNTVYVGGQGELGYFNSNTEGVLKYHSLLPLIPVSDQSFGDVWDIVHEGNTVFFRCSNKIFRLQENKITTYLPPNEWGFMAKVNGNVFVQDFSKGIMVYDNGSWNSILQPNQPPPNDPITAMLPIEQGRILITTLKSGIYSFSNNTIEKIKCPEQELFSTARIYGATIIGNNRIALGSSNGGVLIIDHNGNIIQRFSRKEGLQNNNILSIFSDSRQNLWLGLDNGIDLIAYNSAIKQIAPGLMDASGYTASIFNNRLYVGTSGGLYWVQLQNEKSDLSFSIGNFEPVANSEGQTWNLSIVNNQLFMGHHEGGFIIEGVTAKKIIATTGIWNFIPLPHENEERTIAFGHYKGVGFVKSNNMTPTPPQQVMNYDESSRYMIADKHGDLWVSHPYHGVFKIQKNDESYKVITLGAKEGVSSLLNNHVFYIDNKVTLATEKGVLQFNENENRFSPSKEFNSILGEKSIRYVTKDKQGNYWFVQDKNLGVINSQTKKITFIPELSNKLLSGFEFILPIDERNIFISGEKGVFHLNYDNYLARILKLEAQIRKVSIINERDSLLYGGFGHLSAEINSLQKPVIGNSWKTIRFNFTSALYGNAAKLEYATRLKGFDNNWSTWSDRTEKEFTNLREGHYTFEVKVRNNLGNESQVASYTFEVLPPLHRTTGAYALYILLIGGILFSLYKWQQQKFKKQKIKIEEEKKRILYIHELEKSNTESKLVALNNEKLEAEINFKNSELASSTMHLVKKGELLSKIKDELTRVIRSLENPVAVNEIKKVLKSVSDDDKIDQEWEAFARHFDKVHSEFVLNLKEKYPALSANEVKLCIYLRMNLSSKEIAQLMSISVRGVEISRYRLRKKLGITSEVNLFDHLIGIGTISTNRNKSVT
jgi:ligand-binding sensor domain-containing protein/DNA-binding CsgD family transcriptional regulator